MVMGVMMTPVYVRLDLPTRAPGITARRRGVSHEQRAERISASPLRSEGIRRGRARLASSISAINEERSFLTTLRLAAGLSQAELGKLIDMKQPNVARLEKQPGDLGMNLIRKLAKALSASTEQIIEAAENTNLAHQK